METFHTYFSRFDNLWGHTDILEHDVEKSEFDSNFDYQHEPYQSIIDEPSVTSMTYDEDEQDNLYPEEDPAGDQQVDASEGYQFI